MSFPNFEQMHKRATENMGTLRCSGQNGANDEEDGDNAIFETDEFR